MRKIVCREIGSSMWLLKARIVLVVQIQSKKKIKQEKEKEKEKIKPQQLFPHVHH